MDKHELQNRVYDLEMHLKMSRDCTGELRTEIEQLRHDLATILAECAGWQEATRRQFDLLVQAEAERDMFKKETVALAKDALKYKAAIDTAIERLEEIDARDGGPAWLKAKDLLGCDLFVVLTDLQKAQE